MVIGLENGIEAQSARLERMRFEIEHQLPVAFGTERARIEKNRKPHIPAPPAPLDEAYRQLELTFLFY
jgi:hypothetical protein